MIMIGSNNATDLTCGEEYLDNNDTADQSSVPAKKSGIFGTSSNLVNSIVGAGIIGIPYAFKQSGLIAGVFLLILVSYLTGTFLRCFGKSRSTQVGFSSPNHLSHKLLS